MIQKQNPFTRLCIVFLIISQLLYSASCSEEAESSGETKPSDESVIAEPEDTRIYSELPEKDFGGAEFRILQVYKGENHIHNFFEYDTEEQNGELLNDTIYNRNLTIEERYKVTIVSGGVELPAAYTETNVLAGDSGYHIIADIPQEITKHSLSGCFYNINNIEYIDTSKPWWNSSINDAFEIDGKLCLFSGDYVLYEKQRLPCVFFNSTMAEDYSIGDFYDLVYQGKWTVDRMNEYTSLVKNDLNGDGKMHFDDDQYGLVMGSYTYIPFMLYGMGNTISQKTPDGSYELALTNEKMIDSISKFGKTIFTDNTAWGEEITSNWSNGDSPQRVFESGRALFYAEVITVLRLFNTDINYGVLPLPKYDENQKNYLTTVQYANSGAIAVPADNTEIEMTGILLEALAAESKYTTLPAFIEGVIQTRKAPDQQSAEMLNIIFSNVVYDLFPAFQIGGVENIIFNNLYQNHGENYVSEVTSKSTAIMADYEKIVDAYKNFGN